MARTALIVALAASSVGCGPSGPSEPPASPAFETPVASIAILTLPAPDAPGDGSVEHRTQVGNAAGRPYIAIGSALAGTFAYPAKAGQPQSW